MKFTLNAEFYNKKRTLKCPKCQKEIEFTFNQLNSVITCPKCNASIKLEDNITNQLKKL